MIAIHPVVRKCHNQFAPLLLVSVSLTATPQKNYFEYLKILQEPCFIGDQVSCDKFSYFLTEFIPDVLNDPIYRRLLAHLNKLNSEIMPLFTASYKSSEASYEKLRKMARDILDVIDKSSKMDHLSELEELDQVLQNHVSKFESLKKRFRYIGDDIELNEKLRLADQYIQKINSLNEGNLDSLNNFIHHVTDKLQPLMYDEFNVLLNNNFKKIQSGKLNFMYDANDSVRESYFSILTFFIHHIVKTQNFTLNLGKKNVFDKMLNFGSLDDSLWPSEHVSDSMKKSDCLTKKMIKDFKSCQNDILDFKFFTILDWMRQKLLDEFQIKQMLELKKHLIFFKKCVIEIHDTSSTTAKAEQFQKKCLEWVEENLNNTLQKVRVFIEDTINEHVNEFLNTSESHRAYDHLHAMIKRKSKTETDVFENSSSSKHVEMVDLNYLKAFMKQYHYIFDDINTKPPNSLHDIKATLENENYEEFIRMSYMFLNKDNENYTSDLTILVLPFINVYGYDFHTHTLLLPMHYKNINDFEKIIFHAFAEYIFFAHLHEKELKKTSSFFQNLIQKNNIENLEDQQKVIEFIVNEFSKSKKSDFLNSIRELRLSV